MGSSTCYNRTMRVKDDIPDSLPGENVTLRFERVVAGDLTRGLVPYYHFKITTLDGCAAGHLNFRVGDTPHVRLVAGHIGYEILPDLRGRSLSLDACRAVAPFVRLHYAKVFLTVDPHNLASIRIIEKLGAVFLDDIDVPRDDPAYRSGARRKKRYEWRP